MEKPQTHKTTKKDESTISVAWLITGVMAIIIVVLVGVLATKGSLSLGGLNLIAYSGSSISTEEVQTKAGDYISNELLQGQATAEISEVESTGSLYKFKVTIEGQGFDSYMTKDGKILFPEAFELEDSEEASDEETTDTETAVKAEIEKQDKATAYLFTMSYCPYGNQAEDAIIPVVDLLGDKATIEPHYVIYSNYGGGGPEYCLDDEDKYCSMHGIQELNQNVRELCAFKYDGPEKYWDFVDLANKNCTSKDVDECWEEQGTAAGLDTARIKTCETDEAMDLLAAEVELNKKYNVKGSPALIINDAEFEGNRTADGYKEGICSGFTTEPEECATELSADAATAEGSCN